MYLYEARVSLYNSTKLQMQDSMKKNAEANMRIWLCYVKSNIKEVCKNEKQ